MESGDWKIWLSIFALVWSVVNSFWSRYISNQAVTKKEIAKVSEKVSELDHNFTRLNTVVEQLPSKDFVHRIEKNQIQMEGDINVVKEQLSPIGISVKRIEDFLLSEARK